MYTENSFARITKRRMPFLLVLRKSKWRYWGATNRGKTAERCTYVSWLYLATRVHGSGPLQRPEWSVKYSQIRHSSEVMATLSSIAVAWFVVNMLSLRSPEFGPKQTFLVTLSPSARWRRNNKIYHTVGRIPVDWWMVDGSGVSLAGILGTQGRILKVGGARSGVWERGVPLPTPPGERTGEGARPSRERSWIIHLKWRVLMNFESHFFVCTFARKC